MSLFKKWLLGLVSLFSVLAVVGCSASWTGTGTVVDKNYMPAGYRTVAWSNKNQWMSECYELVIREQGSKEMHKGCVGEHVWNDAMLDHQITLTEEYN